MITCFKWIGIWTLIAFSYLLISGTGNYETPLRIVGSICFVACVAELTWKHIRNKRLEQQQVLQYIQNLKMEYQRWRSDVETNGLQPIPVSVRLGEDELAYGEYKGVKLFEVRVTGSEGEILGASYKLTKDISIGGASTESKIIREVDEVATGEIYVTNKRLIFTGDKESRNFPLELILRDEGKEDCYDIWTAQYGRSQFIGVNGWICNDLIECLTQC